MKFSYKEITKVYTEFSKDLLDISVDEISRKYLGKKGPVKELLKNIGKQKKEERAKFGKEVNILKEFVENKIDQVSVELKPKFSKEQIDVTAPFAINTAENKKPKFLNKLGSQHPLTQELEYVLNIFQKMGFEIEESRQIDNDYNMFQALNFPVGHPARDNWDTFWTEEGFIPPAHTSTMQNRILRKYEIPIRVVIPGRCFRNEATDASHEHTLHQVEGVYIDKDISMGDMFGTIKAYLEAFFNTTLEVKIQPAYFPFTEPDAEFLISCPFCKKEGCKICNYGGWIEIMGCGMIHPNVLKEGGIDSQKYSGFAWGFGLDRMVMIKHGIDDIRKLHSGELEFLDQF
jgi:phenylalanyl-tRNA synthetase alpha chain